MWVNSVSPFSCHPDISTYGISSPSLLGADWEFILISFSKFLKQKLLTGIDFGLFAPQKIRLQVVGLQRQVSNLLANSLF
jgi:hypothetical protein